MKLVKESLEDVFKPIDQSKKEDIEKEIVQFYKGEQIFIEGMEDFTIVKTIQRKKEMYYFIPNTWPAIKYIYGIEKGNIYMKRDDLYAIRELRSGSKAFNKGNPNKMAMPNDLYGAAEWIKERYSNNELGF